MSESTRFPTDTVDPIINTALAELRDRTGYWPKDSAEAAALISRLDSAEYLLRWYVEADLVEAGDEFGMWDDMVREWVGMDD